MPPAGKRGKLPGKEGNSAAPESQNGVLAGSPQRDPHSREGTARTMSDPKAKGVSRQEQTTRANTGHLLRSKTTTNDNHISNQPVIMGILRSSERKRGGLQCQGDLLD